MNNAPLRKLLLPIPGWYWLDLGFAKHVFYHSREVSQVLTSLQCFVVVLDWWVRGMKALRRTMSAKLPAASLALKAARCIRVVWSSFSRGSSSSPPPRLASLIVMYKPNWWSAVIIPRTKVPSASPNLGACECDPNDETELAPAATCEKTTMRDINADNAKARRRIVDAIIIWSRIILKRETTDGEKRTNEGRREVGK